MSLLKTQKSIGVPMLRRHRDLNVFSTRHPWHLPDGSQALRQRLKID